MINHARTLLCNMGSSGAFPLGSFGEELLPSDFSVLSLPTYLGNLRTSIFGTNPDRFFLNYRAAECMRILHSTEFYEYIEDLDSRTTYDMENTCFMYTAYGSTIETITDDPDLIPAVLGKFSADNYAGKAYDLWDVKLSGGILDIAGMRQSSSQIWSVTGGYSNEYRLPASVLRVRFIDTGSANPSGWWRIQAVAKPGDFHLIEDKMRHMGQSAEAQLFSDAEPYKTFKNLWMDHDLPNYRLSGILLAMIYRMEDVRTGG